MGGTLWIGQSRTRPNNGSRMTRECHVRFCESAVVRSPRATHLAVMIAGRRFWLWRAVDAEEGVLEAVATAKRDKAAALKLLK